MKTNLHDSPKLERKVPRCRDTHFKPNSSSCISAPVFPPESVAMLYTLMRFFKIKDIETNGKEMSEQLSIEVQNANPKKYANV